MLKEKPSQLAQVHIVPFNQTSENHSVSKNILPSPHAKQQQWHSGVYMWPPISGPQGALQFNYLQHFSICLYKRSRLAFSSSGNRWQVTLLPKVPKWANKRSRPPKSPPNTRLYPSLNIKIQCNWPSLLLPWGVPNRCLGSWELVVKGKRGRYFVLF